MIPIDTKCEICGYLPIFILIQCSICGRKLCEREPCWDTPIKGTKDICGHCQDAYLEEQFHIYGNEGLISFKRKANGS